MSRQIPGPGDAGAGNLLAALALREFEKFDSQAQAKKNLVRAIESVAARLGNTPTICRKCYIHPVIVESYLEGSMLDALQRRAEKGLMEEVRERNPEEAAMLALLQRRCSGDPSGPRGNGHRPHAAPPWRESAGLSRACSWKPRSG